MQTPTFSELWPRLSGLELLNEIAAGRLPPPPHATQIGLSVSGVAPSRIVLRWHPPAQVSNPAGDVHGGYLAMALDDAAGLACVTLGERFRPMLTLNLHLEYLRTVQAGACYTVTGEVVHPGRRRIVADAQITDESGRCYARATGSFAPNTSFDPGSAAVGLDP